MIKSIAAPMRRTVSQSLRNAAIVESKPSWFGENFKKMDIFHQDIEILF